MFSIILITVIIVYYGSHGSEQRIEGFSDVFTFPPILVINLKERADRRKQIKEEFEGWPQSVEIIEAVKRKPGWIGCTLSHLKCIQIAKERDYPWVLCVEDDCMLAPSSQEALNNFYSALPHLWKNRDKWDIYTGGIFIVKNKKGAVCSDPPIVEAGGYSTHFILVNRNSYDKIIDTLTAAKTENELPKIDVYYSESLKTYTSLPFVALQRPDKSDIENKFRDHTKTYLNVEKSLLDLFNKTKHKI